MNNRRRSDETIGGIAVKSRGQAVNRDYDVSIEGQTGVTIKCGGSSVQVSPSGVTVSGPMISLG